jgi:hypothetical protein
VAVKVQLLVITLNRNLPNDLDQGIQACEEYEVIVKELQEALAPELEMIESRIISPVVP